jgi:hypothetical protein
MLRITVTAEFWNTISAYAFEIHNNFNRECFNDILISIIEEHLRNYQECEKTVIRLPTCITRSERYTIHKFSLLNKLSSESFGEGDDRFMEVTLSKNYVQELFHGHTFNTPTEIALKTDKQVLFETLMDFMETNLHDELAAYMDKI